MARLGHGRRKVPPTTQTDRSDAYGAFVFPEKAPGSGSYPIGDLYHAKLALSGIYAMAGNTPPAKRRKILRAVAAEWPQYNWAAFWNKSVHAPGEKEEDAKYPLYRWDESISAALKAAANPRRNATDYAKGARVGEDDFDLSMEPGFDTKTRAELKKAGKSSDYIRGYLEQVKKEEDAFYANLPWMAESFNPRRNTMARRRRNFTRHLENPLGMPLSGNIQAVIVDEHYRRRRGSAEKAPKRVHIKKGNYALCGAGKGRVVAGPDKGMIKGVKPSDSKTITCYRCLKLNNINKGDDVERMIRAPGRRETHMMVPGGREGLYVSRKQLEHDDYPSRGAQVSGIEYFLGGTDEHPTQPRLLSASQKRARADDLRKRRSRRGAARKVTVGAGKGRRRVANPRSYGQGYERGLSDYHETEPLPASQLTSRSESYQFGYLEGYADQAGGGRKTTSRRAKPAYKAKARRTKRRTNRGGDTKKGRMSNGRMWYMVDGKFTTESTYNASMGRRNNGSARLFGRRRR